MTKLKYTLTRDTLFKLFWTKDMNLLRSFIADALYLNHDSITDIKITNPEIQPDFIKGKLCRLDLRLVVDEQIVDVEVQVEDEGNFKERSLFYWTKLMSETLVSGEDYKTIPKVILINIIDFKLFVCPEYHSDFRVIEKTRHEELTDKFAMHFFELPMATLIKSSAHTCRAFAHGTLAKMLAATLRYAPALFACVPRTNLRQFCALSLTSIASPRRVWRRRGDSQMAKPVSREDGRGLGEDRE